MPNFVEHAGLRKEGQCGEITAKVYDDLYRLGWVKDVNAVREAAGHPPLDVMFTVGNSKTHFRDPGVSSHIWVSVAERGKPMKESLVVDGSLREISTFSESGYSITEWTQPTTISSSCPAEFKIGSSFIDESDRKVFNFAGGEVLGVTESGNSILTLEFVSIIDEGNRVAPVLTILDAQRGAVSITVDLRGNIWWMERGGTIDATDRAEGVQLMTSLWTMQLAEGSPDSLAKAREQGKSAPIGPH